jgi:hypothetical protein
VGSEAAVKISEQWVAKDLEETRSGMTAKSILATVSVLDKQPMFYFIIIPRSISLSCD